MKHLMILVLGYNMFRTKDEDNDENTVSVDIGFTVFL